MLKLIYNNVHAREIEKKLSYLKSTVLYWNRDFNNISYRNNVFWNIHWILDHFVLLFVILRISFYVFYIAPF